MDTKFISKLNTVTNQPEVHFQAELLRISDTLLEQTNASGNKTEYFLADAKYIKNGKPVQFTTKIYKNSLIDKTTGEARMAVGNLYNVIGTEYNGVMWFSMSSISTNPTISATEFDFNNLTANLNKTVKSSVE